MTAYGVLGVLLVVSPLGICLTQAILTRIGRLCARSIAPQIVAVSTVLIGNVPVVWLAWKLSLQSLDGNITNLWCGIVYAVLTYNALGFCYFCVLNASETSLHVHIIMELLLSGNIRSEELARRYNAKEMINARIERMIALGQLKEIGGRFVLSSRTLVVTGRLLSGWRKVLGLPLSPH